MKLLVATILLMLACSTCERDWRIKKDPSPWEHEWDYVCVPSGRMDDAQVTHSGQGEYHLWSRGADYGEYETLAQAKQKGEEVVKQRNLTCP